MLYMPSLSSVSAITQKLQHRCNLTLAAQAAKIALDSLFPSLCISKLLDRCEMLELLCWDCRYRMILTEHRIIRPSCLILWAQDTRRRRPTAYQPRHLSIKCMEACCTTAGNAGCENDKGPPFKKRPAAGFQALREHHQARVARRKWHRSNAVCHQQKTQAMGVGGSGTVPLTSVWYCPAAYVHRWVAMATVSRACSQRT